MLKTLAKKAAWDFSKEAGLEVVITNPGTVMGSILPPSNQCQYGIQISKISMFAIDCVCNRIGFRACEGEHRYKIRPACHSGREVGVI